jgi:hypothetical protein
MASFIAGIELHEASGTDYENRPDHPALDAQSCSFCVLICRYHPAMTETPHLHPATREEIANALSFALRYKVRKRVHDADDVDGSDHS